MNDDMWDREDLYEQNLQEAQQAVSENLYEEEVEEDFEEDFIDNLIEEEEFEVDEESFMNNARVRLEQARLYEMLIKHDLFDGVDADVKAVERVQEEIKTFIVDRLEILLGMRVEKETEIQQIIQPSQFNDVEVQALKMIASKVTKGASTEAPTTEPEPNELNVVKKEAKKQVLNTLGSKPKVAKKPAPTPKKVFKPKDARPLRKTPKKSAVQERKLKKEMKEVSTEGKSIDDIAKRDMKYVESLKNMSLEEAGKVVAQRHNRPRSPKPIDQNIVNSHYQQKVALSDGTTSDYGKIMKLVALQKAQEKG